MDGMSVPDDSVLRLHSARYACHKIIQARYREMVMHGLLGADEARARYIAAMRNFDDIVDAAPSGASYHLNDASMKAGFDG